MSPHRHLLCGTILSIGTYVIYKNPQMALSCMIGSVAPDLDHLIEYAKYCDDYSVDPAYDEFVSGKYFDTKGTVYVVLHGWEYAIIGFLFLFLRKREYRDSVQKGFIVGYTSHLILDQYGNNLSKLGYFWLYRWWNDFKQISLRRDV